VNGVISDYSLPDYSNYTLDLANALFNYTVDSS